MEVMRRSQGACHSGVCGSDQECFLWIGLFAGGWNQYIVEASQSFCLPDAVCYIDY